MTIAAAAGDNHAVPGKLIAFPQAPEAIELRHLRSFVAVAEDLNFGRAAARLYLSQPALSRQISALERLVGCELLRRSTHQVELTLAGEALLDRARRVLGDVDEAVSVTQSVGGELAGRVARLWEPMIEAGGADDDLQEMRNAYEALHGQFSPPPEIAVRSVNTGGARGRAARLPVAARPRHAAAPDHARRRFRGRRAHALTAAHAAAARAATARRRRAVLPRA
jgi:monoterpene epsilon-lactone hydrolase